MVSTLNFHDFSWRGDRKWATASRWTVYCPIVVCFILLFSMVQIACGSIWVVQLGSNLSVYVSQTTFSHPLHYCELKADLCGSTMLQSNDNPNPPHPWLFLLQRHPLSPPTHAPPQQPPQTRSLVLLHFCPRLSHLRHPLPRHLRPLPSSCTHGLAPR